MVNGQVKMSKACCWHVCWALLLPAWRNMFSWSLSEILKYKVLLLGIEKMFKAIIFFEKRHCHWIDKRAVFCFLLLYPEHCMCEKLSVLCGIHHTRSRIMIKLACPFHSIYFIDLNVFALCNSKHLCAILALSPEPESTSWGTERILKTFYSKNYSTTWKVSFIF